MTGAASAVDVDFDKGTDVSKAIEQAVTLDMPYPGHFGMEQKILHEMLGRPVLRTASGPVNY